MASTNETTNLKLSQFDPSDKPSWLNDYNTDMQKIDAGYAGAVAGTGELEDRVVKNETNIATMKTDINGLLVDYNEHSNLIQQNTRNITTNRNNIDTLDNRVEVLEDDVAGLAGADEWIIVGDSWGVGYMPTVTQLNPNRTIHNACKSGAGFIVENNTFLKNLQNTAKNIQNKGKISRIFVFGGLNDQFKNGSETGIKNAVTQLCQYCAATFAHGRVYVGFLGGVCPPTKNYNVFNKLNILNAYASAQYQNNASFISGMEFIHNNYPEVFDPSVDTAHPSANGYQYVGHMVSNVINTLTCNLIIRNAMTTNVTYESPFTGIAENNNINVTLIEDTVWIQFGRTYFTVSEEINTGEVKIGTAESMPYINPYSIYVCDTLIYGGDNPIPCSFIIKGNEIWLNLYSKLVPNVNYWFIIIRSISLAWC